MSFVHLHVHSEYSLLDGAARVERLAAAAARERMPALALTDHGALFGAVPFYKACARAGVKPIIGMEAYVARRSRFDRQPRIDDSPAHLVLLATDDEGYRNLVRLTSAGYVEGFYYKPRIDLELLARHQRGLVALSGCLAGDIPRLIAAGRPDEAKEYAARLREIFGPDRFFIELQDHGLRDEVSVNRGLVQIAGSLGLGLVATNDSHYVEKSDARVHDVLLCIQTNAVLTDADRMRFPNQEYYLKPAAEMAAAFAELPEAIVNTLAIAERCDFRYRFGEVLLPPFPVPNGETPDSFLRRRCLEAVARRFPRLDGATTPAAPRGSQNGRPAADPVFERLDHELGVIARMGYAEYFLIVADFVEHAREAGIPVGPGRGSGAGSLVAYLLGITDIDPLRYGLLFERFLNPERVDMPDFDIDFCYERRGEVIDYVVRKYGQERVAQVITFGTLGARAAIRDVGRALGKPYGEVDALARLVPFAPGMTLDRAMEQSPDLRRAYQADPAARELVDLARAVEGMPRHASIHAAGVVIARDRLTDHVPLARTHDDHVVTQFGMDELKDVGLLKMDFLGLRTLTVLNECLKLLGRGSSQAGGSAADRIAPRTLPDIPLDDPDTLRMLGEGDALGVFQLEAGWVRDFLRKLKPSRFEDIAATVALCRPGPMENIPLYLQAKEQGASYPHPLLEPVLRDTYGVLVYQEQIMQVASVMAGFNLGQADLLRRAVGKKQAKELKAQRQAFIEGCLCNGHSRELADQLYDLIEKFANFGFNRAHAVSYGLLAYQCAYLKRHHPVEFFAALLSSLLGSQEKVALYIDECRRLGVAVHPPDVNRSRARFTVEGRGIRFGLAAVKNVGELAIDAIVQEREAGGPFRSLRDFCERVEPRHLGRKAMESLIKAGTFDSVRSNRAQLLAALDATIDAAQAMQRFRAAGQVTLFAAEPADDGQGLPDIEELPLSRRLNLEKEVLGLYLSGHPLEPHLPALRGLGAVPVGSLQELPDGQRVVAGGVCAQQKRVVTRGGESMAFVTLEDLTGQVEVVVFPRVLAAAGGALVDGTVLVVRGRIQQEEEQVRLLADQIGLPEPPDRVYVRVPGDGTGPIVGEVRAILAARRGTMPVLLQFAATKKWISVREELWVDGSEELRAELEALLGPGSVVLARGPRQPNRSKGGS